MRYVSVCSGIEAATVAWHHMGWQPAWFSEIEPFPSAVLRHHYPDIRNMGDMTKYGEWPDEPVDLLVGGTPCQSFSVAGLRAGLADPRGGLMLTYLEIARRYRPRWIVWENVPGVLSSNGGRDFGSFLGALGQLGYGWAYRVLDAQWFGVAQRRRRVFVVGYLGDGHRPAKVLFERESVRRDTPPSRETREEVAGTIAARFGISRNNHEECVAARMVAFGEYVDDGTASTMKLRDYKDATDLVAQSYFSDDPATTICANEQRTYTNEGAGFKLRNCVAQPVHYRKSRRAQSTSDHETWVQDEAANTLNCFDVGDVRAVDVVTQPFIGGIDYENNAHGMDEPTGPLLKGSPTGGGRPLPAIATMMQVRRLTVTECERLQGFPDGYTNIPWRKAAESPDGPRYKALGNSMAVPVMRWIGERINGVDNE